MVATHLDAIGHSVAIIDIDSNAFRRLGPDYSGQRVKGVGFDRAVMKKAGIEDAYGFVAVSDGDNTNIVAARVARETFGVKHVIARIMDPRRAEVFQRLGIPTTGTVKWNASSIIHKIMPDAADVLYTDAEFGLDHIRIRPIEAWIGTPVREITRRFDCSVGYIARLGETLYDTTHAVIQEHDELFICVAQTQTHALRQALTAPPKPTETEE